MTPQITWREDFEIGVASVDHEHRLLIAMINEVLGVLPEDSAQERVADLLGDIHARISAHFALEEKIMRELNYDEFDGHKSDHERLLDDIRDIMDEVESGAYHDYRRALAERLDSWFTAHFRAQDARLHRLFG
jgi:hemerythrin